MAKDNLQTVKIGNIVVSIDRIKCLSCAACTAIAPKTFEMDDELISTVKSKGPYDDERTIKDAASGCPDEAITVTKAEQGAD